MKEIKKSVERELLEHLMPFWNQLIDRENGGFYGCVSNELVVDMKADKGGIATARLLWSYSRLYGFTKDESLVPYLDNLYEFFTQYVIDKKNKGSIWMVDYQGNPVDKRKHLYAQAFSVYGLSEYYKVTGNIESLEIAKELYQIIEKKGYDTVHEGYLEEFTEVWEIKDNEMLSENGVVAYFTMNTHLHILEAYTNLYRVWKNDKLKERLISLIYMFKEKIYDCQQGSCKVFFDENWTSLIDLNSYGHDIEATWLIQDALDVLEIEDDLIDGMINTVVENIYSRAIAPDGSILNEKNGENVDKTRIWWVQTEAMVGFLKRYTKTGNERYKEVGMKIWNYILTSMVDTRIGGEWYYSIEADTKPTERDIVEPWKTPYHNLRGCIEVLELQLFNKV